MRKFILIASALVVLCTFAIVFYVRVFTAAEPKFTQKLDAVVPEKMDGWTIEELPIAETEGMRQYAAKLLQFDQCVSRIFSKGALKIVFYVAYWEPNGKTPFDAGGHNPDSCWVNVGWARLAREYSVAGKTVEGRELLPFEYGVYAKDGTTQPAIFWHLVNGVPFVYEMQVQGWREGIRGAIERTSVRIEDFKRLGLNQRREQMFIRISFPDQKMKDVWVNPDFQQFLLAIAPLGLFKDQPWK